MKAGLGFARMNSEMTDAQKINTQQQWNVKARKVKEMKMRNRLLYQRLAKCFIVCYLPRSFSSRVTLVYSLLHTINEIL